MPKPRRDWPNDTGLGYVSRQATCEPRFRDATQRMGRPAAKFGPQADEGGARHSSLRETQPWRLPQFEEAGELEPLDVMRANMEFFHYRAAEILASVMAMPLGEDATPTSLPHSTTSPAWSNAGNCRSIAPAIWPDTRTPRWPQSPPATLPSPGKRQGLERIPTPKAVSDAFAAARLAWRQSHASACSTVGVVVGRSATSAQTQQDRRGVGGWSCLNSDRNYKGSRPNSARKLRM